MTYLVLIASSVVVLDRLTKFLVFGNFYEGRSVEVIPKVLHLTLVLNTGAAFGILKNGNAFFTVSSLVVVTLIIAYAVIGRCRDLLMLSALGLILGGAVGNLIDRVLFGYIIDFLDLRVWPVFNVADSAISAGSVLLILRLLFNRKCCTQ
jgi:signal peptidase II